MSHAKKPTDEAAGKSSHHDEAHQGEDQKHLKAGRHEKKAETTIVVIHNGKFEPQTVDVKVGDKVRWENQSGKDHSVAFNRATPGRPESSGIIPGGSFFETTFEMAGTFEYHDSTDTPVAGAVTVK